MPGTALDQKIHGVIMGVSPTEKYQMKLIILMWIIKILTSFPNLFNSTIFMNPLFKCGESTSTQHDACGHLEECYVQNDFTATFHAGLICERRNLRMAIQSIQGLGLVVGMTLYAIISDRKGRKTAFLICLYAVILALCLIFIGVVTKNGYLILLGNFLNGTGCNFTLNIGFTISSELFSQRYKQISVILLCSGISVAQFSTMLFYYIAPIWWFNLLFLSLFPIILSAFVLKFYLVQTPQFLIGVKRDLQGALNSIQLISQHNEAKEERLSKAKKQLKQIFDSSLENHEEKDFKETSTIAKMFKNRQILKTIISLMFIKFAFFSFYFGAVGSVERIGYNPGVTVFLIGLGEFIGYNSNHLFISKLKRKTFLIGSNLIKSFIGMAFIFSYVESSPGLQCFLLFSAFVVGTYNFTAIAMLETQSFQSGIKSTAIGLTYSFGYLSRVMTPYMIGFLNEKGVHPLVGSSILLLVLGIVPAFFIKQTWGQKNVQEKRTSLYSSQELGSLIRQSKRTDMSEELKPLTFASQDQEIQMKNLQKNKQ